LQQEKSQKSLIEHPFIDVLKTFTPEEADAFRKFLESPYFNTSEKCLTAYNILFEFYPNFDKEELTKEYLYSRITPEKQYKDTTVRALLFELLRHAERFLKQTGFENAKYGTDVFLLDEILRRGVKELFPKNSRIAESKYVGNEKIEGNYFLDRYQLAIDRYNYRMIFGDSAKSSQVQDNINLMKTIGMNLLSYFVIDFMKVNDNIVKYSRTYNLDYKSNPVVLILNEINLKGLIERLQEISPESGFVFELYSNLYLAFAEFQQEDFYFKYKHLLLKHSDSFSRDERHQLYLRLRDYCFYKCQSNDTEHDFQKELFEIDELFLVYEYYRHSTNTYLPVPLYRTILLHALKLRRYDWIELLANFYLKKVRPDQYENLYNYTYAYLHFAKKEFTKSLEFMMQVDYDHFAFRLDMKALLLMIYYELGYYDSAFSLIDCYRHFLKRNKLVSKERKAEHLNFIAYVEKLLKRKSREHYRDAGLLKDKIQNATQIVHKEWLIEKAEEMNKKYRRTG
jgi:hypothetical protein